jgi:4,5-dihydroxyphthalate decarboxylase
MTSIQPSIALEVNDITRPIHDGTVTTEGIELATSDVHSRELVWRQLRFAEFDVAQMPIPSLLILADRGNSPWLALPIFPQRLFWNIRVMVRADSSVVRNYFIRASTALD